MEKVAIVGVTGVVGETLISVLQEHELTNFNYVFYASEKSAGTFIKFNGKEFIVEKLTDKIFDEHFDYAFFCTTDCVSKQYCLKLARRKTYVIDFSAYYRKRFPLIVPQVNASDLFGYLICNPNCSTIAGVMALYAINNIFQLKRIVYSTYQAVSGAGQKGLNDLLNNGNFSAFRFPIKDNLIPQIGDIMKDGYSVEEKKMIYETRKILGNAKLKITATCVRIPITIGHSLSINFETTCNCKINQIAKLIEMSKGVRFLRKQELAMPLLSRGQELVLVSRLRRDGGLKNCYNIFVSSDNLRKGAAQNAVEIFELLLKKEHSLG